MLNNINFSNDKIEEITNIISEIKKEKYISLPKYILDGINNFKTHSNERSEVELEQFKNITGRSQLIEIKLSYILYLEKKILLI